MRSLPLTPVWKLCRSITPFADAFTQQLQQIDDSSRDFKIKPVLKSFFDRVGGVDHEDVASMIVFVRRVIEKLFSVDFFDPKAWIVVQSLFERVPRTAEPILDLMCSDSYLPSTTVLPLSKNLISFVHTAYFCSSTFLQKLFCSSMHEPDTAGAESSHEALSDIRSVCTRAVLRAQSVLKGLPSNPSHLALSAYRDLNSFALTLQRFVLTVSGVLSSDTLQSSNNVQNSQPCKNPSEAIAIGLTSIRIADVLSQIGAECKNLLTNTSFVDNFEHNFATISSFFRRRPTSNSTGRNPTEQCPDEPADRPADLVEPTLEPVPKTLSPKSDTASLFSLLMAYRSASSTENDPSIFAFQEDSNTYALVSNIIGLVSSHFDSLLRGDSPLSPSSKHTIATFVTELARFLFNSETFLTLDTSHTFFRNVSNVPVVRSIYLSCLRSLLGTSKVHMKYLWSLVEVGINYFEYVPDRALMTCAHRLTHANDQIMTVMLRAICTFPLQKYLSMPAVAVSEDTLDNITVFADYFLHNINHPNVRVTEYATKILLKFSDISVLEKSVSERLELLKALCTHGKNLSCRNVAEQCVTLFLQESYSHEADRCAGCVVEDDIDPTPSHPQEQQARPNTRSVEHAILARLRTQTPGQKHEDTELSSSSNHSSEGPAFKSNKHLIACLHIIDHFSLPVLQRFFPFELLRGILREGQVDHSISDIVVSLCNKDLLPLASLVRCFMGNIDHLAFYHLQRSRVKDEASPSIFDGPGNNMSQRPVSVHSEFNSRTDFSHLMSHTSDDSPDKLFNSRSPFIEPISLAQRNDADEFEQSISADSSLSDECSVSSQKLKRKAREVQLSSDLLTNKGGFPPSGRVRPHVFDVRLTDLPKVDTVFHTLNTSHRSISGSKGSQDLSATQCRHSGSDRFCFASRGSADSYTFTDSDDVTLLDFYSFFLTLLVSSGNLCRATLHAYDKDDACIHFPLDLINIVCYCDVTPEAINKLLDYLCTAIGINDLLSSSTHIRSQHEFQTRCFCDGEPLDCVVTRPTESLCQVKCIIPPQKRLHTKRSSTKNEDRSPSYSWTTYVPVANFLQGMRDMRCEAPGSHLAFCSTASQEQICDQEVAIARVSFAAEGVYPVKTPYDAFNRLLILCCANYYSLIGPTAYCTMHQDSISALVAKLCIYADCYLSALITRNDNLAAASGFVFTIGKIHISDLVYFNINEHLCMHLYEKVSTCISIMAIMVEPVVAEDTTQQVDEALEQCSGQGTDASFSSIVSSMHDLVPSRSMSTPLISSLYEAHHRTRFSLDTLPLESSSPYLRGPDTPVLRKPACWNPPHQQGDSRSDKVNPLVLLVESAFCILSNIYYGAHSIRNCGGHASFTDLNTLLPGWFYAPFLYALSGTIAENLYQTRSRPGCNAPVDEPRTNRFSELSEHIALHFNDADFVSNPFNITEALGWISFGILRPSDGDVALYGEQCVDAYYHFFGNTVLEPNYFDLLTPCPTNRKGKSVSHTASLASVNSVLPYHILPTTFEYNADLRFDLDDLFEMQRKRISFSDVPYGGSTLHGIAYASDQEIMLYSVYPTLLFKNVFRYPKLLALLHHTAIVSLYAVAVTTVYCRPTVRLVCSYMERAFLQIKAMHTSIGDPVPHGDMSASTSCAILAVGRLLVNSLFDGCPLPDGTARAFFPTRRKSNSICLPIVALIKSSPELHMFLLTRLEAYRQHLLCDDSCGTETSCTQDPAQSFSIGISVLHLLEALVQAKLLPAHWCVVLMRYCLRNLDCADWEQACACMGIWSQIYCTEFATKVMTATRASEVYGPHFIRILLALLTSFSGSSLFDKGLVATLVVLTHIYFDKSDSSAAAAFDSLISLASHSHVSVRSLVAKVMALNINSGILACEYFDFRMGYCSSKAPNGTCDVHYLLDELLLEMFFLAVPVPQPLLERARRCSEHVTDPVWKAILDARIQSLA